MACGLLSANGVTNREARHRHIPYAGISGPCYCILTGSLSVFEPKATNLLPRIDAVPWPFYDAPTSSVRHCIIVFQTLFPCNSSFSAPQNVCDVRSWLMILVLVNFGFSSSTVDIFSGFSSGFGVLGMSVRIQPCMPGCSTSQCRVLLYFLF